MRRKLSQTGSISSGGIGFTGLLTVVFRLLTVVFIVLKLMGEISWSWVWVLSPIWITAAYVIFILFVCLMQYIIYEWLE